jgi:hypothetical protein
MMNSKWSSPQNANNYLRVYGISTVYFFQSFVPPANPHRSR